MSEHLDHDELRSEPLGPPRVDRRGFLGALGGVAVAVRLAEAQRGDDRGGPIAAWLHLAEDGAITCFSGKVDVGQNVRTTLAQVVAEELRVPAEAVTMVLGDTDLVPYDAGTFGSQTTPRMVPLLRRAAVSARELLVGLAAERWQVERGALTVADGAVHHGDRRLTFAELTRGRRLTETVGDAPATPPGRWRVAGRHAPKSTGRAIVTGAHRYPSDIVRPGLLYGKVLRPPASGATLKAVETTAAAALAGVTVVRDGDFIGVTAPDETLAERALAAIRAEWETTPQPSLEELPRLLRPRQQFTLEGVPAAIRLTATYTLAYIAHVPLEPRAAVAEWADDRLTVWCGTQRPFGVRQELARAFRLNESQVRVYMPDTGSGYGGKHTGEVAVEAARLARAAGRPVKLVWTRAEEFQWAYFRPAGVIDVHAGVDEAGKLTVWEHHNYNSGPAGINTFYDVPRKQTEFHRTASPLRQGSYRGLAGPANFFARESMMDELAAALGQDPLAFRLANLTEPRLRRVFQAAAERFGWGARPPAGRGYGLAGGYEKLGYVATCAEVEVVGREIRPVRLVTAFDCGPRINPDTVDNQIEGMHAQGLGGALLEAIEFRDGVITNGSLLSYRVPRFADMCPCEIVPVEPLEVPSTGAGETPLMAIAPALAGAVWQATGQRLRDLPLRLPAG